MGDGDDVSRRAKWLLPRAPGASRKMLFWMWSGVVHWNFLITSDHHKIRLNSVAEESRINTCSMWSFHFKCRVCNTMRQLGNKPLKN